jgi:undecaprenyl-diphosphatase
MNIFEALFLGVMQGVTEFLPVSSSGHLVLLQHLLGVDEPGLLFDVAVHFGTLLAVLAVFRQDVAKLLTTFFSLCTPAGMKSLPTRFAHDENTRLLMLIIIGTIPTVLIGLLFKDLVETMFSSVAVAGGALLVTGTLLLATRWRSATCITIPQMAVWQALIIGVAQGLALTPGISRSGATIAMALFLGIERETSGRFSFLLCLPAIIGAVLLNVFGGIAGDKVLPIVAGTLAAAIVGYLALVFLLRVVRRGKFHVFAPYCYAVGALALYLAFLR